MWQREGENQNNKYLANWPVFKLSEVVVQLEVSGCQYLVIATMYAAWYLIGASIATGVSLKDKPQLQSLN